MDVIATLELQRQALIKAERALHMAGRPDLAREIESATTPLDFKAVGKLPAMMLITGRARCSCDNAEVVAESIGVPYDIDDEHFAWMCKRLLRHLRAEVSAHILKQGHGEVAHG